VVAPFILYVLGYDDAATETTYLVLTTAFFSQIPKRFIWRYRPHAVGRADGRRSDVTSSFPSRAVTCGVVYAYSIGRAVMSTQGLEEMPGWVPVLMIFSAFLAACARINLGVHYPSDTIVGGILGVVYCFIGTGFHTLNVNGCRSCKTQACYGVPATEAVPEPDVAVISSSTLDDASVGMFFVGSTISAIIYVICVEPPVNFWKKCDLVFGVLLACIVFQATFLCPGLASPVTALPVPPSPKVLSFVWALFFSALVVAIGLKLNKKLKWGCFGLVYINVFFSLITWRLLIQ